MLSFFDVLIWCYHLVLSFIICYHLMLSFLTVWKCFHFCVIIFPCTGWVLSFMLSFNVIIFCYHFPPFIFFLKTWHTQKTLAFLFNHKLCIPSVSLCKRRHIFVMLNVRLWVGSGPFEGFKQITLYRTELSSYKNSLPILIPTFSPATYRPFAFFYLM